MRKQKTAPKLEDLVKEFQQTRQDYLKAKVRLLDHMLKTRRIRRKNQTTPIQLPDLDRFHNDK